MAHPQPLLTIKERVNTHTKERELYIKVAPKKWQRLMVYNYEQLHGPVTRDCFLKLKDPAGDRYDPQNLNLVRISDMAALRKRPKQTVKKRERRTFTMREPDLTGKMRVYIPEKRMHVYVNPDSNISDLRAKYLKTA